MKNYWLDRKSAHTSSEDRWKRLELLSTNASFVIKDGLIDPISYKLELRQNGKTVLHPFPAWYTVKDGKLIAVLKDGGKFPLSTYKWIADQYNWGKDTVRKPIIQATLKGYVRGKCRTTESHRLSLENIHLCYENSWDEASVRMELTFNLVA